MSASSARDSDNRAALLNTDPNRLPVGIIPANCETFFRLKAFVASEISWRQCLCLSVFAIASKDSEEIPMIDDLRQTLGNSPIDDLRRHRDDLSSELAYEQVNTSDYALESGRD
jgi:hypothetical protein